MGRKLHSDVHLTLVIRINSVYKHVTRCLRVLDVPDSDLGLETGCVLLGLPQCLEVPGVP